MVDLLKTFTFADCEPVESYNNENHKYLKLEIKSNKPENDSVLYTIVSVRLHPNKQTKPFTLPKGVMLYYITKGKVIINIDDNVKLLQDHDFIAVESGQKHFLYNGNEKDDIEFLIYFRGTIHTEDPTKTLPTISIPKQTNTKTVLTAENEEFS
ncbi:MAG: hypothetical protein DA328_06835 [Nitrososphaeraceae archaeon]|nr:hypothetical protein [Nitrososphaeraceae archaeon]